MKRISFEPGAFKDFADLAVQNKKLHKRVVDLIMDIKRSSFTELGKPEPLRHELKDYWPRRINEEHRLVYQVTDDAIIIVSCRYHYG